MSQRIRESRMDLKSRINRDMWTKSLDVVGRAAGCNALSDYESEFYRTHKDAWDMVGDEHRPTIKQFNYMRQLAFELEKQGY